MTDPKTLFDNAREGDLEAFSALTASIRPRLQAIAHLRLPESARAQISPEDIVQETLLQALESLATFEWRGADAFHSWLIGIANNRIRRTWRSANRTPQEHDEDQTDESPIRQMRQEERFERLQSALDTLSPTHREVVVLASIEGLRIKDIAARMGKTPSATSMLLLRALRALRNTFGETESLTLPDRALQTGKERP